MVKTELTGADHFAEAERLLREAARLDDPNLAALAQAHATLALASANAELLTRLGYGPRG